MPTLKELIRLLRLIEMGQLVPNIVAAVVSPQAFSSSNAVGPLFSPADGDKSF